MNTYPLGWQSWSPPTPIWPYLPHRDYCPVLETTHLPPKLRPLKPPITYWCSWYAIGSQINQPNLLHQVQLIKKHGLNISHILIDDGWTFSPWLKPLIEQIHSLNFKVGIWFAPYTKHKHLPLYSTLDQLIQDYHIDLLKLDFLYKPYFTPGLVDDTLPHQQIIRLFDYLQLHYPQLYTIACGCPFSPALGRVDAIRFSKDITFPPPIPDLIRRLLYFARMQLLFQKYHLIPKDFPCAADPDVRMFSLDNSATTSFWSTIHSDCRGIGDNLDHLSVAQIKQVKLWLQKNPSSPSSSPL